MFENILMLGTVIVLVYLLRPRSPDYWQGYAKALEALIDGTSPQLVREYALYSEEHSPDYESGMLDATDFFERVQK